MSTRFRTLSPDRKAALGFLIAVPARVPLFVLKNRRQVLADSASARQAQTARLEWTMLSPAGAESGLRGCVISGREPSARVEHAAPDAAPDPAPAGAVAARVGERIEAIRGNEGHRDPMMKREAA